MVAVLVAESATWLAFPTLIAAGVAEGSLLAGAQAHVLCRRVPGIRRTRWLVATGCAAGIAWAVGLLPSLTDGQLPAWPRWLLVPVLGMLALVLVCSIGTAQWWSMRDQVRDAGWWVFTTAGAWAAGIAIFAAVTTPLWQPGQAVWLLIVIGLLGGSLMAASVAALTGWAFVWLTGPQRPAR